MYLSCDNSVHLTILCYQRVAADYLQDKPLLSVLVMGDSKLYISLKMLALQDFSSCNSRHTMTAFADRGYY